MEILGKILSVLFYARFIDPKLAKLYCPDLVAWAQKWPMQYHHR